MRHEIDLSNFQVYNDFSKIDGLAVLEENKNGIKTYSVSIDKENALKLNKREGKYSTIEFQDITDIDNRNDVLEVFVDILKKFILELGIDNADTCLIIGLGNKNSTPDSLGARSICDVIVTNHLYELVEVDSSFRRTYKIVPGVVSETGINSFDYINSIVKKIKPDFVIVIDSLVTNEKSRICKSIQITDSGIVPGSGVLMGKGLFDYENLKRPVIAIGVPTVVLIDENFMLVPNELDFLISKLGDVIGKGINKVLHTHKLV